MAEIQTEYLMELQGECRDIELVLHSIYEKVQAYKKNGTVNLLKQIESRLYMIGALQKFIGEALMQYEKTDHDIADVIDQEIVLYPETVFATSRFDELNKQINLMPFHRE